MNSSDADKKLTAERYGEFAEALGLLYIKGNISARIQFSKEWPQAGAYIFGEELLRFDADGAKDKKRRAVLEEEAETRRQALEGILETLEEKSVDKGALQLGYVEELIKTLGRDLALLLYAPRIVDRFMPPAPVPEARPVKAETSHMVPPIEEAWREPEEKTSSFPKFEDLKKRKPE